jgi:hypothetical protein
MPPPTAAPCHCLCICTGLDDQRNQVKQHGQQLQQREQDLGAMEAEEQRKM